MNKKDNPVPSLDNTDYIIIEKCLKVLIKHKNMKNSKNRIQSIIDKLQNGVETNNEQPLTKCEYSGTKICSIDDRNPDFCLECNKQFNK